MSGKLTVIIRRHWPFVLVCLAFFATSLILTSKWFRFYINPDASSYFTIAQKYAHLDIRHAVSAYWGPLISWLLVPAVWLHVDMIIAAKLLAIFTSLAILATVYWFLLKRGVSQLLATWTTFFLSILLVNAAVAESITPDLLIALLIAWFAITLSDFISDGSRRQATMLGVIGAFMYFAKGFGFFLFLAILGLLGLWFWQQIDKKLGLVIHRFLPTMIIFVALVAPFILAISLKYHQPTINTAGSFDHALFGPQSQGKAYPMITAGPLVPPKGGAISIWEDPSKLTPLIPGAGWSPLDSGANFKYFAQSVVGRNINRTVSFIVGYGAFVAFGVVILFIGSLQQKAYRKDFVLYALITTVICAGYSLVLVESRYLLGCVVLALIGAGLWLSLAQKSRLLSSLQIMVGGLLICSVTLLTTFQTIVTNHDPYAARTFQIMQQAKSVIPSGTNIISDNFSSYELCYHFKLYCYGVLSPSNDTEAYYDRLKQLNIGYLINYHTHDADVPLNQFIDKYFTSIDDRPIDAKGRRITVYRLN